MEKKYTVTRFEKDISIMELLEKYFDYEFTHEKCRECPGYQGTWSCPPFDFDPKDFLEQYSNFHLVVDKIDNSGASSVEEAQEWLFAEKERYDREVREMEIGHPGYYGMAAQECQACKKCARLSGHPCVHPDIMRYGLEALGCFPVQIVHDKLGFDIIWSDGNSIPEYYLLVAGILMKE